MSYHLACYPNPNPKLGRLFHTMCELYLFSVISLVTFTCSVPGSWHASPIKPAGHTHVPLTHVPLCKQWTWHAEKEEIFVIYCTYFPAGNTLPKGYYIKHKSEVTHLLRILYIPFISQNSPWNPGRQWQNPNLQLPPFWQLWRQSVKTSVRNYHFHTSNFQEADFNRTC